MRSISLAAALAASTLLSAACDTGEDPTAPTKDEVRPTTSASATVEPPPSPLVTLTGGGLTLQAWPFTGRDLGGTAADPINLVFPGVDARSVRAALVMLDGVRAGPLAAFDCTWKEAMGANQTAWSDASGWTGSAIQLECGDYGPIRFHIRLFPAGAWTLAGAHFEVQIPGTNEHEVLSWELAEQLVTFDLARAGVLGAAPAATDPITPAPTYRAINPLVYNGLPAALRALTGGPLGDAAAPVPILNDGRATILAFAGPVQGERTVARREFVLAFDQTIPKPFCMQGPLDWLRVSGPIQFTQHVVVAGDGSFRSHFHARGALDLVPVNPLTGQATGEALRARVNEHHRSLLTDRVTLVTSMRLQLILGGGSANERLFGTLHVGPGASDHAGLEVSCGS